MYAHINQHEIEQHLKHPFTNTAAAAEITDHFLHSLSGSFWTAFTDLEPVLN